MRSEFRFPKATVALMAVILAAVVWTIEKAKAISASVPHTDPQVGPISPEQITIVPTLLLVTVMAVAAGMLGWAVLYALRRSGMQKFSEFKSSRGV
jgi:Ca2+/H+ antiporter